MYDVSGNSWNDTFEINYGSAYYIKGYASSNQSTTIRITGKEIKKIPITLTLGFNFMSWPFVLNGSYNQIFEEEIDSSGIFWDSIDNAFS